MNLVSSSILDYSATVLKLLLKSVNQSNYTSCVLLMKNFFKTHELFKNLQFKNKEQPEGSHFPL